MGQSLREGLGRWGQGMRMAKNPSLSQALAYALLLLLFWE